MKGIGMFFLSAAERGVAVWEVFVQSGKCPPGQGRF